MAATDLEAGPKMGPEAGHEAADVSHDEDARRPPPPTDWADKMRRRQTTSSWRDRPLAVVVFLAAIVFVVQLGNSLSDVPSTRLLEDIICRDFYGDYARSGLIDEAKCQMQEVQGELNIVSTGLNISGFIPGILVALLYGSLADRWGRKPVFGLCMVGITLSSLCFILITRTWKSGSIRAVWACTAPLLIGGGSAVAEAMVFAIASDLSSELNRATHFQIVVSAVLLAETVAPVAAQALMDRDIWLPLFISPGVAAFGAFFIVFIPETLHRRRRRRRRRGENRPLRQQAASLGTSLRTTVRLFDSRPALLLTPSTGFITPLSTIALSLALRYLPLRYGLSISQAGVLLGLRTGLSILVLVVALPLVSRLLLLRRSATPAHKANLRTAQASAGFLVIGLGVFAAAPRLDAAIVGLVVFTLGSGVPTLCRAVVAALVDDNAIGRLFAAFAALEIVGYLAFALGLGALFQVGIGGGGLGDGSGGAASTTPVLGLPYYVAAWVALCTSFALWLVKVPDALARRREGGEVELCQPGQQGRSGDEAAALRD